MEEEGGEEGHEESKFAATQKKYMLVWCRYGAYHLLVSMLCSQSELDVFFLSPPWLSPSSNLFRPCGAESHLLAHNISSFIVHIHVIVSFPVSPSTLE